MTDIDELLQPNEDSGASNADVWHATTRVLRRRRWWRRGRVALVMIGCFVAGAIVMDRPKEQVMWFGTDIAESNESAEVQTVVQDSPGRLERRASSQVGEKQRTLFRQAGDGYLKYGDEVAAVRCYRKALDGGSPPELAVKVDDTWLLMSLKVARNKE